MANKQRVAMHLPFPEQEIWQVTAGNSQNTHVGDAEFCWDFVRFNGATMGTSLRAASSGVVVQVEQGVDRGNLPVETTGNFIEIEHCPGEIAQYGHIGKGTSKVVEGYAVSTGQEVGLASDTGAPRFDDAGKLVDNSHLHFALLNKVSPVANNKVVAGQPWGKTIPSEFIHYEVCNDPKNPTIPANWSYVRRGVPTSGQVLRRAAVVPDWWKGFQPAAVSMSAGRMDVFAVGDDRRMWHNAWVNGSWTKWKDDTGPGTFTSGPAAVSMASGRIDLFALGDDRRMWHNACLNNSWTGWKDDTGPGTFLTGPAAVSMAPGRIDLFALGDDRCMWHNACLNNTWTGWKDDTGVGTFKSAPAAVAMTSGRIDVFALGDDRCMWHNACLNNKWSGWKDDTGKGTFKSGPAAVSMAAGRIDLFALGDDRRMWHDAWVNGAWTKWIDDTGEGTFCSMPAAVSMAPDRIDVFVLGIDRWMWHEAWRNNEWSGWNDDTGAGTFTGK